MKLFPLIALSAFAAACPVYSGVCTGSFAEFFGMPPVQQPSFEACVFCCNNGTKCEGVISVDEGEVGNTECNGFVCSAVVSTGSGEHELSFDGAINASATVNVVAGEPRPVPSVPAAFALAAAAFAWVKSRG